MAGVIVNFVGGFKGWLSGGVEDMAVPLSAVWGCWAVGLWCRFVGVEALDGGGLVVVFVNFVGYLV